MKYSVVLVGAGLAGEIFAWPRGRRKGHNMDAAQRVSGIADKRFKAGDTVKHGPTGETWTVAATYQNRLSPCGWPCTLAEFGDCTLVSSCSIEDWEKMLRKVTEHRGEGSDPRYSWAAETLRQLEVERRMDGLEGLNFADLRRINRARCEEVFHRLNSWSPNDWATAATGELGELCNLLKKHKRGEQVLVADVEKELADVVIYLDLLAERLEIDLGRAVRRKFNEVSDRRSASSRLPAPAGERTAADVFHEFFGRLMDQQAVPRMRPASGTNATNGANGAEAAG